MTSLVGRVRQTVQQVFAWVTPVQDAAAQAVLSPAEYTLYLTMPLALRKHHLRVYFALCRAGETQPQLLKAALLHDVGKTRYPFRLFDKIVVVVVKVLLPHQFKRWGAGEALGWRRRFVVSAQHPAWGAEMVEALGSDPLMVTLIRRHQDPLDRTDPELKTLLAALQAADDRS